MVLRKQNLFFLFLVLNGCLTKLSNGDESSGSSSDSDDDRLQQALVLVDILKSEYIKALNENAILRENANNATSEELSTCAPTEEGNVNSTDPNFNQNVTDTKNATTRSSTTTSRTPSPLTGLASWPQLGYATQLPPYQHRQPLLPYFQQGPLPPFPQQPAHAQTVGPLIAAPQFYVTPMPPNYSPQYNQQEMGPFRRMLPRDYYYFDNNNLRNINFFYRRMQNRDENENVTGITNNVVVTERTSTTSPTPRPTVSKSTTTKSVTKKKTKSHQQKDPKQKKVPDKKVRWSNPLIKEVANELLKEIDFRSPATKNTAAYSKKKKHYKKSILRSKPEQNKTTTEEKKTTTKRITERPIFSKTTLRIHMEGSTRLQLPLSENNPYCYYSPKSALCRSSL